MDEVLKKEVTVSKPEDWPVATDVRMKLVLETLSHPLSFDLHAISFGDLRTLEEQIPMPEAPITREARPGVAEERDYEDVGFQEKLTEAHFMRWVLWIDRCWKSLPGANPIEKAKWAEANICRSGEIAKLFGTLRTLSGYGTGAAAMSNAVLETKDADPETWAKASQGARLAYKIPHPDVILVFDLAGLSQLKVNQIRETCRAAPPPMMPEFHKLTRKPIPGSERLDYTDPKYQQALKDSMKYENCLLLEAAMFPFPGATKEEKRKWLDLRPAYEVNALLQHLTNNVISYRDRTDFI